MAPKKKSNHHRKGLELAGAGKYQEALACIQEHLCNAPDDTRALNDAGAVLYCLGRPDEAVEHFVRAKSVQGGSAEILWNLVEVYLGVGRVKEAAQLFDNMERMGILKAEVLNRTANAFLAQDNKAGAIEMLQHSLEISPEQRILQPMIEVIRSKMPKVAFFCGSGKTRFLNEVVGFIKQRFEVRFFEGRAEDEMEEIMQWSDISWFEKCANLAVTASKLPKICENVIRVDNYDIYKQWPKQVNWANIDILVTAGSSIVRDILVKNVPGLESQTSIVTVPSCVNLEKFEFINRRPGKNIAFLANLTMPKNPAFVLQCMQKLHYIDPEYRLFFGGEFEDPALEHYLKHTVAALGLRDVVFFDGGAEDVSCWLEDKHYIVSTSIIEDRGMGLLEGMACGLKPVIHNFPDAEQVFPAEFLFNISEEFCEQICSDKYEPQRYRRFVEENYPMENQLKKINNIFRQLESEGVTYDSGPVARIAEYRTPITNGMSQITDREAITKGF